MYRIQKSSVFRSAAALLLMLLFAGDVAASGLNTISRTESANADWESSFYSDGVQAINNDLVLDELDFDYRFKITSSSTLVTSSNTNLYFDLSMAPAGFWSNVNSDGGDIRVTKADGNTQVAREVSGFDLNNEKGSLFFDSTGLATSTATEWYVYYGNSTATELAATSTYGRYSVWDESYESVFHLNEEGDGTAGEYLDSKNNTDLTAGHGSNGIPATSTGKMGLSQDFNGVDTTIGGSESKDGVTEFSISVWMNPSAVGQSSRSGVFGKELGTLAGYDRGGIRYNSDKTFRTEFRQSGVGIARVSTVQADLSEWSYVVFRWKSSTTWEIMINGSWESFSNQSGSTDGSAHIMLGEVKGDPSNRRFEGLIDEARYLNSVKNREWFETEYNNQNNPDSFWSVGSQEDLTTEGIYFGFGERISNPLSLDGLNADSSEIEWSSTEPAGTDITIKTAVTDSDTEEPESWQTATNLNSISGITQGMNLSGKYLWVKQELTTSNSATTSALHSLSVEISGMAVVEFVSSIRESGGDYSMLATWESNVQSDLSATTTRVFSGTSTGVLARGNVVTVNSSTTHNGITATVVATTLAGQILVQNATSSEIVVLNDGDTLELDASNYWTVEGSGSDLGASASAVARIEGSWSSADTTPFEIDNWGTSDNNYIKIYTAGEARHNGVWDESKYYMLISSGNTGIIINVPFTTVSGIQMRKGGWGSDYGISSSQSNLVISHNIIKGTAVNAGHAIGIVGSSAVNRLVYNNVIFANPGYGIYTQGESFIYNNTIAESDGGGINNPRILGTSQTVAKNNIVQGSNINYSNTFHPDSSNNISSDSTAPGSESLTYVSLDFVDRENHDFRLKPDSPAIDAGADLSSEFTDDIRGLSRTRHEYWDWDIGAFRATKEVIAIVDTDSSQNPDYTSLSAAIQGESGTSSIAVATSSLVAADEQLTIELRASSGLADTATVDVDGFETAENNYLKIWTDPDGNDRHSGFWDDSKYRLYTADGHAVELAIKNLKIIGVQGWQQDSSSYEASFLYTTDQMPENSVLEISTNIIRGPGDSSSRNGTSGIFLSYENFRYSKLIANNNVFEGWPRGWNSAAIRSNANIYVEFEIANNTVYGSGSGIELYTYNCSGFIKNNAVFINDPENGVAFASTQTGWSGEYDHNITSDATALGENSLTDQDPYDVLVDPDNNDFRLKSDSPARDSGLNLSDQFTDDIRGLSRIRHSYWKWDIGAFRATKEVIAIVDTDSSKNPDYTSLSNAINGEAGSSPIAVATSSLVAADEQLTIELRASSGVADTSRVIIDGFETSEHNFLNITVHPNHRHNGLWDTSAYRIEYTGNYITITANIHYITLDGLQIADGLQGTYFANSYYSTIKNNIVKNMRRRGIYGGGYTKIYNNIIYNCSTDGNYEAVYLSPAWRTIHFYNNVIYGNQSTGVFNNLYDGNNYVMTRNNISMNNGGSDFSYSSTLNANDSNNISSDATAPGSNSLINQDPYAIFEDPDNGDFRLKSGSPAIAAAVDLSDEFKTDIIGTYRGQEGGWDIGAFEYFLPPDFRLRGQIKFEGNVKFE